MKKPEYLKEGDGCVDITLHKPMTIDGVQVTSVRMREPTVADQEAASVMTGSDATREIQTFANLCNITPDDIRKMTMRDYKRLQTAYVGFID
jgi:hypothetical protein